MYCSASKVFIIIQLVGALRAQVRYTKTAPLRSLPQARSLSLSCRPPTLPSSSSAILQRARSVPQHARHISLGSIFSRKPTPTPPPVVVAKVAQMEAEANANPQDVQKQIALFEALVATGVKPGYDVVIARWERMCEFVSCLNAT